MSNYRDVWRNDNLDVERQEAALDAGLHVAALNVLKKGGLDASEACRMLWWLCAGHDVDRVYRVTRVAQVDGCMATLIDALHAREPLKWIAARTLLTIVDVIDTPEYAHILAECPEWFRLPVVIRQDDAHYCVVLYAQFPTSQVGIVCVGGTSVKELKANVMAQAALTGEWGAWSLALDGRKMFEEKSVLDYDLTSDSNVELVRDR